MLHNLLQAVAGRPMRDSDLLFVREVRLADCARTRRRRVERVILLGWLMIAAKCGLVAWAVHKYQMPFDPLWVNAPTVLLALICTSLYFSQE